MSLLREKMSQNGFESNSSYEFEVECLLKSECAGVRTLNVQGGKGRHKTAFANALARSLDYQSVLYFDFDRAREEEEQAFERDMMQVDREADGKFLPPVSPFDKLMSDACAYSESELTFVILDQLQLARFCDHLRLHRFVQELIWTYPQASFYANPKKFILCLISEEPLYHSLQKNSYRIWVEPNSMRESITAQELGVDERNAPLILALNQLFADLGIMPTLSEFKLLLNDLLYFVRQEEQFASAIYARVGGIDRVSLYSQQLQTQFKLLLPLLEETIQTEYIALEDNELLSDHPSSDGSINNLDNSR